MGQKITVIPKHPIVVTYDPSAPPAADFSGTVTVEEIPPVDCRALLVKYMARVRRWEGTVVVPQVLAGLSDADGSYDGINAAEWAELQRIAAEVERG
jgi:hypothetical protein